ncbi:P-loop NTPase (plasmid) [Halarchaeum sp. CBA1220]|uniref:P-loop NTPase n=1 Tax=Halarchaeum sp. CBA1220 TaxID=1853682 RepID=UPI000F3A9ECF|nr:P-loop NTPase [Halarchaeum sp. CBA1220]QLC35300.1 P-loop NTPase [Halarchaeum sp. CBA1220]
MTPDDTTRDDATAVDDRLEPALRQVREPNADVDVIDAGLVQRATLDGDVASVGLDAATLDAGTIREVTTAVDSAVRDVPAVDSVTVHRAAPTSDPDATGTDAFERVIAVASAKGGVGKSTVATQLACALAANGDDVALFDADIHGPNVPALLDVSGPVHATEDGAPRPVRSEGLEVMSVGLLSDGAPLAWRGAMAHDAVSDLFADTAWTNTDTLVVDLPPGTGDVVLTTLQEVSLDGAVVVTTPFHSALSDTEKTVELLRENDVPVLGTAVNMAGFTCERCDHDHDLFAGDTPPAERLDTTALARLPFTPALQETPTPTSIPDPVADLAAAVEERYDAVWSVDLPESGVDLRGVPADERRDAVADAFGALEAGEEFVVASDRDPTPVRAFLGDLADGDAPERFEVRRQNPETWLARTVRP